MYEEYIFFTFKYTHTLHSSIKRFIFFLAGYSGYIPGYSGYCVQTSGHQVRILRVFTRILQTLCSDIWCLGLWSRLVPRPGTKDPGNGRPNSFFFFYRTSGLGGGLSAPLLQTVHQEGADGLVWWHM